MPPLEIDPNNAKYQIRAYGPGQLQINEKIYTKSVILSPDEIIENWAPQSIDELTLETLLPVIPLKPDVLLLGTGSKHILLPVELYGELINQGIGVEIMDTRAACRTFNALASENRRVVAALLIS